MLFTSESVSEGHPDKLADRISDTILDRFLRSDPLAKVACETFIADDLVVVAGEFHTELFQTIRAEIPDLPDFTWEKCDRVERLKAEERRSK